MAGRQGFRVISVLAEYQLSDAGGFLVFLAFRRYIAKYVCICLMIFYLLSLLVKHM